jgi:hypothetical protein
MESHSHFLKSAAYVESAASSGRVRGVFAIEAA